MFSHSIKSLENSPFSIIWGYHYPSNDNFHLLNGHLQDLFKEPFPLHYNRLKQTHSDLVFHIKEPQDINNIPQGDALITTLPYNVLVIKSADCLSVMLNMNHTIAVIHAGWKGTKQKIVQHAIKEIIESDPDLLLSNLFYSFMPHIQDDELEVGKEFLDYGFHSESLTKSSTNHEKYFLNLKLENTLQIKDELLKNNIKIEPLYFKDFKDYQSISTFSNNEFPSYRRDKKNQRLANFILMVETKILKN